MACDMQNHESALKNVLISDNEYYRWLFVTQPWAIALLLQAKIMYLRIYT